jgi:hypothetical protein
MELSKINIAGFYFRKSNCEWTVQHEVDSFPINFNFESFDLETLTMTGFISGEEGEENLPHSIEYTQEQVDAARAQIV